MKSLTARERFLAACARAPVDRPPVWLMRQAGRYLPEYRALKERHSFIEMVRTPALAAEVTLQPLRRFPLDAAIIFSDILVVPEALGQPYQFREQGGISLAFALDSAARIHALNAAGVAERLQYVADALRATRCELGPDTALLGFAGTPWTLAAYMAEGGAPAEDAAILRLARAEPALFHLLMEKLTRAVAEYLRAQLAAGADAVQLFDSWAARCPDDRYEEWSLRWVKEIVAALPADAPVILFAKDRAAHAEAQIGTGACVLSLDAGVNLAAFRTAYGSIATQGNLDPALLEGEPEAVRAATRELLRAAAGPGHIVNLGHGVTPRARIESVAALVETVAQTPVPA
jgi:uroporphyrinogen decarboxylase